MKLRVRAIPNARKSEAVGWDHDDQAGPVLRIRIAAPPVDGKANAVLRNYLAQWLDVPKSKVLLEKGNSSRYKTFEIPDATPLPEITSS